VTGRGAIACMYLARFFIYSSFNILWAMTPEYYPTSVRNFGLGKPTHWALCSAHMAGSTSAAFELSRLWTINLQHAACQVNQAGVCYNTLRLAPAALHFQPMLSTSFGWCAHLACVRSQQCVQQDRRPFVTICRQRSSRSWDLDQGT